MKNNRPIFVPPFSSKVYAYPEKYNILANVLFGFRRGYSTITAFFNFVDSVPKYIDNSFLAGGIFTDFAKAIYSSNHVILKAKLQRYGIDGAPSSKII